MLPRKIFITLFFCIVLVSFYSFTYEYDDHLKWENLQKFTLSESDSIVRMSFEGGKYYDQEVIPRFIHQYSVHTENAEVTVRLENMISVPVTIDEEFLLKKINFSDTNFFAEGKIVLSRKEPFVSVEIIPVKWNSVTNQFEKLISFQIRIEMEEKLEQFGLEQERYSANSVLATGDWFKIKIDKSGIFKLSYEQLQSMGFNVGANPENFALFGNGGGILPEQNNLKRHDDLVENPIEIVGIEDNKFGPGDYILFYGQGPVTWKYQILTGHFRHQTNFYDNFAYYFLTVLDRPGKRIAEMEIPNGSAIREVTQFTDYQVHEIDQRSLAGMGRIWYGEMFDFNNTYQFSFTFPNAVQNEKSAYMAIDLASSASSSNSFQCFINNNLEKTVSMPTISETNVHQIARNQFAEFTFTPNGDDLTVKLIYQRLSGNSSGYLNYFDLNVKRNLIMTGNQMMFREPIGQNDVDVLRFKLSNVTNQVVIWDITDPVNAAKISTIFSGNQLLFDSPDDTLRQFIAFNGNEFYEASFVEKVANQNLHAIKNIDYLIITHPDFIAHANQLAAFHQQTDGFTVFVTTPQLIANEFASGSADITGMRDFIKMLYDKSDPGKEIKYLLMFGDASYDYKSLLNTGKSNFVSTWESTESWNIVNSIASDDYFGYLDDGEGYENEESDRIDIGIGRFVVSTPQQATMAVNKGIYYSTNSNEVMESWRNTITFIADDGDNNLHLSHGELLSSYLLNNYPVYNIDKIYVDAYQQVSTPAGQRVPEVNQGINNRMDKGSLIMNYNGHGGEIGFGHEQFLQNADINSWTNYRHMPVFITATCEFSRYDDPNRVSAGELVFLNENGGAIAMFSTARATYASSNLALNLAIYENNIFTKEGSEYPRFGDVIRKAKKQGIPNDKKFILIGDPALRLAYPKNTAKTISINGKLVSESVTDTINALSKVTIVGEITDAQGETLTDYNGIIFPTIFDKQTEIVTLGDQNNPTSFLLRNKILFNGQATIKNGEFTYDFIVPKDIAYKFGEGRISYYFRNENEDGNGYYENFLIGGIEDTAPTDTEGPEVNLYMNDSNFISGGITNENPVLLAVVFDESGINTTGNGIGHDIMAVIDGSDNSFTLNNYYEAERDSYQSGKITYPFSNLDPGDHSLSLKVWDIYNNSTIAYLNFKVVPSENLTIENLLNYPNPFSGNTNFIFDHNQTGQNINVSIKIYDLAGRLVKTLSGNFDPESYQSEPLTWNATTDSGDKISAGMYVYIVVVQNENGSTSQESGKLLYIQ